MIRNGFFRCGISSIGGNVGDIYSNVTEIEKIVIEANENGVDLLVFPELCLTGYTMQDMFFNEAVLKKATYALDELLCRTVKFEITFVVGMPLRVGAILYNVAVVAKRGKILGVVPKTFIPNQNEFYEKRYFSPYRGVEKSVKIVGQEVPFGYLVFESIKGITFGIEICEDLWSVIPPSLSLALSGANVILNLSASNELIGKDEYRKELVKTQSARTHSAYVYTSAGLNESTTDVVFGGSGYIFENGKELICADRYNWNSTLKFVDVDVDFLNFERIKDKSFADNAQMIQFPVQRIDTDFASILCADNLCRKVDAYPFAHLNDLACKEIFDIQSYGLAKRLKSINCKNVTIGISGGLDSTLALLVTVRAFEILDFDKEGIFAITMPGFGTSGRTYKNALELCKLLGVSLEEISIKEACTKHFEDIGHDINNHNVVYENVQARERTQILMDKGFTIGTGDLSELALGWCTYNGDHMSMYSVNASIPKTLVKYLVHWYAKENTKYNDILCDIIDTPISPELLPTDINGDIKQKTESKLGPYEVHDFFLYHLLRRGASKNKLIFLAEEAFKNIYTEKQINEWYNIFESRFFSSQFKRDCVPGGPKVGSVALSPRGDLRLAADMSSSILQIKLYN